MKHLALGIVLALLLAACGIEGGGVDMTGSWDTDCDHSNGYQPRYVYVFDVAGGSVTAVQKSTNGVTLNTWTGQRANNVVTLANEDGGGSATWTFGQTIANVEGSYNYDEPITFTCVATRQ